MVANLAGVTTAVSVTGLGSEARVRLLDETTFDLATMRPESFRADRGRPHETTAVPTAEDIQRLLAVAPEYGIEVRLPEPA